MPISRKAATKKTTTAKKTIKRPVLENNRLPKKKYEFDLQEGLQKYFGFTEFKGTQEKAIKSLLAGDDTFVIMPTGGGKSLCYQLPAMLMPGCAIIVSPLIAL
ncbi:MAG TPA: DEAD/DEAH box helicase, partial [Chitinophagaceae bacterium]|nr:DEAD/DEAH box helicase [Chitinophagaceae bacterium]